MHAGAVVHRVVAAFERHLLEVDVACPGHGGDVLERAGQTHDAVVEVIDIALHGRHVVPLGIDTDEHHLKAIGIGTQGFQQRRHLGQGCRADVGALREAVEPGRGLAEEIGFGDLGAVLVHQGERRRVDGLTGINRRVARSEIEVGRSGARQNDERPEHDPESAKRPHWACSPWPGARSVERSSTLNVTSTRPAFSKTRTAGSSSPTT